jgi:hypothetical protein
MTRAADLDALAISQALAALDPRWGEPTGTSRGLLWRHPVWCATVVVSTGFDHADYNSWVCATVTMHGDRDDALNQLLDQVRAAIWGPTGYVYVTYPPGGDVNLSGRTDGLPSPFGPP